MAFLKKQLTIHTYERYVANILPLYPLPYLYKARFVHTTILEYTNDPSITISISLPPVISRLKSIISARLIKLFLQINYHPYKF